MAWAPAILSRGGCGDGPASRRQDGVKKWVDGVKMALRAFLGAPSGVTTRVMADVLTVLAVAVFVAIMFGLIWALERV